MYNRKKKEKVDSVIDFDSLKSEQRKILEFLRLQALAERLRKQFGGSSDELIKRLEADVLIPASIFCRELAALETVCKYLKENLNLSNRRIAFLIGRGSKSIWQAYNSAKKKHSAKLDAEETGYFIPASILRNKKLGVQENIVLYIKEQFGLSYHEIAVLLKRNDRTIWTAYKKAREKYVK